MHFGIFSRLSTRPGTSDTDAVQEHFAVARAEEEVVYGTPESVADRLRQIHDSLGLNGFILDVNCAGLLPLDRVLNSMRLLSSEVVVPRLS